MTSRKEYCLITSTGTIVNMSMNYTGVTPVVNEFQKSRGYKWVPVSEVSQKALNEYEFYGARP